MKICIKCPDWDYFPVLVLECDPWRAPPSATFMNTMGTSPPAISHRRLISGDHWAMMDEVGHAVIENTINLAMPPVRQKTQRTKTWINTNKIYIENADQDLFYSCVSKRFCRLVFDLWWCSSLLAVAGWCLQNWFIVVTKFRNRLMFEL